MSANLVFFKINNGEIPPCGYSAEGYLAPASRMTGEPGIRVVTQRHEQRIARPTGLICIHRRGRSSCCTIPAGTGSRVFSPDRPIKESPVTSLISC